MEQKTLSLGGLALVGLAAVTLGTLVFLGSRALAQRMSNDGPTESKRVQIVRDHDVVKLPVPRRDFAADGEISDRELEIIGGLR